MLGTKADNYKESLHNLQEFVFQYVVKSYKRGVYIAPIIGNLKDFDLSGKKPIATKGNGTRATTEITKTRYELELKTLG